MKPIEAVRPNDIAALFAQDEFHARHLGPRADEIEAMLEEIGCTSIPELIEQTVPASIRVEEALGALPDPVPEHQALAELRALAAKNEVWRSFIGCGYAGTLLPETIRRNVLENPGWYTAYTPYQAEIAQGRLEALLNFQQMVIDLTGLPIANASLLDEATAGAEAMTMIRRVVRKDSTRFFVDAAAHPQVIAVMRTRAKWMGIELVVGEVDNDLRASEVFGAYLQYPDTYGRLRDPSEAIAAVNAAGGLVAVGTDPLALMLLKSPGAMGAAIAVGSAQRFGVALGYGGPHAAFMAAREELVRSMPGRIIGVSRDASGRAALRMALQTREQHIRREKATSNICTAQALLANIAAFYAIWHGPEGLARIALRAHFMARLLAAAVGARLGTQALFAAPRTDSAPAQSSGKETQAMQDRGGAARGFFDTVTVVLSLEAQRAVRARAEAKRINLGYHADGRVTVAFDECTTLADVADVAGAITGEDCDVGRIAGTLSVEPDGIAPELRRTDAVLGHPVFHRYRSETEFVRYLKRLENRDFSLVHGMIPLGSCTMKLNAAAEMAPITWPELANLHPFVPAAQARGYAQLIGQLERWLADITGFARISFQPNSGAQGEYAGLLAIRNWHAARGQAARDVCLIPSSAHGTNPASAQMMGLRIVVVACDEDGNIDLADLRAKLDAHRDRVAALMVTYPSTHGVFEDAIVEILRLVHEAGGQVYMDGANLNAQSGLAKPGLIGADVCHLNLHKTFCIPHGGGGPGMGPIGVAAHLVPHLPGHPFGSGSVADPSAVDGDGANAAAAAAADADADANAELLPPGGQADAPADTGSVAAAPYGSALILAISWMYIRMMGATGIRRATEIAILNANYVASRLAGHFDVLYAGATGRVAHECILDLRHLRSTCGVSAEDVAKRLMDYGFHAPTLSFPVVDTLMVEPTESEGKAELDRFCEAMIAIKSEIDRIAAGELGRDDNPLRNAPHTAEELAGEWTHAYSRDEAVYPVAETRGSKFWPAVKRIDNAAGDRHLVCTCPPMSEYL